MQRINFDLEVKMKDACNYDKIRPALNNIYFSNGFAYASNGYILVKNSINEISTLDDGQIKMLDGKMIHGKHYKEIIKYDNIIILDEGIKCFSGNRKALFYFCDKEMNYPNADEIINRLIGKVPVSFSEIKLTSKYIVDLNNALFKSSKCKYIFFGKEEPILVCSCEYSSVGLIMPCL